MVDERLMNANERFSKNTVFLNVSKLPEVSGNFPELSGNFPEVSGNFPQLSGSFPKVSGNFPETFFQLPGPEMAPVQRPRPVSRSRRPKLLPRGVLGLVDLRES